MTHPPMRSIKPARFLGGSILAAVLLGCCLSAPVSADVTITVDELGNGTLVGPAGTSTLPASTAADPGPGGLASVLTYGLLNPPDLVFGDVQLVSGGVVIDVIRFVPAGTGSPSYAASLLFYSSPDGNGHLVPTPTPPSVYYPNVISAPFGSVYTPGPGQPGYVSTGPTHYNFNTAVCTYSLTPGSASFTPAGGSGSFMVTTQGGCPIAPATTSNFLTFMVSGNTVNYTVPAFPDPNGRTGTITVGGQTFTVTQSACAYSLTPGSASFPSSGGTGSFSVTTPAGCPVAPATTSSFLTFMVSGNTVNYTVAASTDPAGRSGTITVGGQTFTITQASACSYSLTPTSASYPASGGSGSFVVITATGCPITPATASSFLTFSVSGASVSYSVAPFTGDTNRQGTITVGGQAFTVTESAAPQPLDITIQPQKLSFTSGPVTPPPSQQIAINGGDGKPFVLSVNMPWITVTPNSTKLPTVLTVSVNPLGLSGNNTGAITLSVGGVTQLIPVQYFVQGLPSLLAIPDHLTFNYTVGGPAPASQQLNIYSTSPVAFQAVGGGFVSVSPGSGTTTQMVTVTVDPSKLGPGSYPATVTVTASGVTNSPLVVPVTFNITSTGPQFTALGVVNAASFQPGPFAPGSLISIFGAALATNTAMAPGPGFPTSLGGVSMTIDGIPVPLQYVSPGQINAQLPFEVGVGQKTLALTVNGATTSVQVTIAPAAPGLFLVGGGRGAILNQDFSLNGPGNAALVGSSVLVFFTGQGLVTPPVATGAQAPSTPLSFTNATTTATIGTLPATVMFSGLAPGFVGLGQANVIVPGLATKDYPLVLTVNGQPSNAVTVAVKTP